MKDFGYDVSDYCDIEPLFGTLSDFDALIDRAHSLGLKVMIDQAGRTRPTNIPGLKRARANQDNPRHDWYTWAEAKADGSPPNNWLSVFGGSAWTLGYAPRAILPPQFPDRTARSQFPQS